MTLVKKSLFR